MSGFAAWRERSTAELGRLIASPASLEAAPIAAPVVPAPAAPRLDSSVTLVARTIDSAVVTPPADSTAPTVAAPTESLPPAMPAVTPPAAPAPLPPLLPVVAQGRTELHDGMYALRSGDTVTVHFDTPEARTRRPEKFEQIVRATLPEVHGPAADSLLATIAAGNLVGPGELASGQTPRPISLRGRDGHSLSLWPETRPGRDGPLVVAYRVTPSR